MSTSTTQAEHFPTSGLPTYLEYYWCYHDPSQDRWLDGMEYRHHAGEWDERAKAKWRYLYRPIRALVGRPQKRRIREAQAAIAGWERRARDAHQRAIRDLILAALGAALAFVIHELLVVLPLAVGGIRFLHLRGEGERAQKAIESWRDRIAALRLEIAALVAQIPSHSSTEEVEAWYAEEVRQMEKISLAEMVNRSTDDPGLFDEIHHDQLARDNPYGLHGLLIEGWGAIQPDTVRSPLGPESTGLQKVTRDVGKRLTTWRKGSRDQPIYRVVYLQYVFLLEKNINVCGFFYDLVTGKRYGRRSEAFQYNHVSNYAVREVDPEESECIRQIEMPSSLRHRLFNQEINAFTLGVSSGSHLRCVLIDATLVRNLNEWLEEEQRRKEAELSLAGTEGAAARNGSGGDEMEGWGQYVDPADLDEVKRLYDEGQMLEDQGIHVARRALQQIRDEVENYVLRVRSELPAS